MRENPLRSASASPCRTDLVRSIQTISVRGTITSRAMVLPSSNTDWIICRSPCSTTPRCSAMSTSSRSSTSEENGPSRNPRPGVIALPSRVSSAASGLNSRPSTRTAGAPASATRLGCCRPRVRGPTPTTAYDTTIITTTVSRTTGQRAPNTARATIVTRTVAVSSHDTRSMSSRLVYRGRAATTAASAFAPGTSSRTNSSTRAFDTRPSAESTQASSPPIGTSRIATISATMSPALIAATRVCRARSQCPSRTSPPVPGRGARIGPRPERAVQSRVSRACRSNISFSSSGSPWS